MLTIQLSETDWEKVKYFLETENIAFQTLPTCLPSNEEIIDLFEALLKELPEESQNDFIKELANMIPATPDAVVEWQGRLHYHQDDRIQAGAYLRVFPAVSKPEITNFRQIMQVLLENRTEKMWEMMQDDLYYFAQYAQKPYELQMGKSMYIAENMATFMFSFWGEAQTDTQKYFEERQQKRQTIQ